ncbi:unnamed protein product, partial [Closterium sp. NIES-64]
DLSSNDLTGSLDFLAYLPALQYLDLHATDLTGEIPTALGKATALSYLDLSFSPLTGSLEFLDCLPALQYLDLHATELTGEIPTALGKATALSYLSRHHPYLPPTPFLSLLHRVTNGSLSDKPSPHLPPTLCTPPSCSDLSFSPLTGSLEFLDCLPALQYLYAPVPLHFTSPFALDPLLRTLKIARLFISFLPHMPARRSIAFVLSIPSYPWSHASALNSPFVLPTHGSDLHATELTGEIPTALGKATALSYLNLARLGLTGPIPTDAFRNLTALQELDLFSSPLTGSLEFLAYLPALQYLSLAYINLTAAELPASLSSLTNLVHLYVTASASKAVALLCCTSHPPCSLHITHRAISTPPTMFSPHQPPCPLLTTRLTPPPLPRDVTAPYSPTTLFSPPRSSPFPADWTALTSLDTLRAAGNGFSGSLPAAISALTFLSELYAFHEGLSYNALVGSLPVLPSSLVRLSLSHNALEGPFSASPAAPQFMEHMRLSHNRFTWPTQASLSGLSALVTLDVSYNDLSGPIPPSLASLPALDNVDISHNALSGGLDVLAHMTHIFTLNIGSCNLSGAFPAALAQLALAELDISNNSFTGPFPSAMLAAPQYTRLNLSANNFSGPLPAQLTTLTTVNSLDISHNQFTGVVPPAVFTLPSLTALDISNNQLSGPLPDSATLPNVLESL